VARARAQLKKLGYKQELHPSMGPFHNFALSFSVFPTDRSSDALGHGLKFGGPLVMLVGWPIVALLTLSIAVSLAQLASAYPTAGALYHWAAIHGGAGLGYFTAWLKTLGQFAITAVIDYGLAKFAVPMLGLPSNKTNVLAVYAVLRCRTAC
jgi:amino acid transporter